MCSCNHACLFIIPVVAKSISMVLAHALVHHCRSKGQRKWARLSHSTCSTRLNCLPMMSCAPVAAWTVDIDNGPLSAAVIPWRLVAGAGPKFGSFAVHWWLRHQGLPPTAPEPLPADAVAEATRSSVPNQSESTLTMSLLGWNDVLNEAYKVP